MPNSAGVGAEVPVAPAYASRVFTSELERRDLRAATAALTRDACFLTRDATAINGREEIRVVLAQLIARRPLFQIEPYSLLSLGDLVLARERWTMHFQVEAAAPLREATNTTLLLR